MKTAILCAGLCLTVFGLSAQSQTDQEKITTFVKTYFESLKENGMASSLDYVYPGLFDIVPRATMEEMFVAMEADTTMKMSFADLKVDAVSDVVTAEGRSFANVDYQYVLVIQVAPNDNVEENAETNKMILGMYKTQYGEDKVTLDEATNTFRIDVVAQLLTIKSPDYEGWRMLERKPEMESLLQMMVPEEVLGQL